MAAQRARALAAAGAGALAAALLSKSARADEYACGGEHTLALSRDGKCFSAGACGLGWSRLLDVTPDLLGWRGAGIKERCRSVTGGYYHSLALGASGTVYAWGCGVFNEGKNDGVQRLSGNKSSERRSLLSKRS